jgi:hypothetical protein
VRSGRTTWIVAGGWYWGARLAPGKSTGVSPRAGARTTGAAKSAGVSPIFGAGVTGLAKSAGVSPIF